ncbi:MAG: bifunctional DNA-formamidopyrimidine glycosylase/DNA-(apurinic or apyrimidinic site) lyase [Alphaproteobacteria bacterium]
MPELPEVETVRRGLAERLTGRALVRVQQRRADLRMPFPPRFAQRLQGRRVEALGRRGKYLLIRLDDGWIVVVHLGMSGRLIVGHGTPFALGPHDHVVFHTDDDGHVIFQDSRRFGLMTLAREDALDRHPLLAVLGPDPLSNGFSGAVLATALAGRRTPLKSALMDQRIVAGLGNIYACESLFRGRLSPRRRAGTVTGARAERLARAVQAVVDEAIAAGGSSIKDYVQASGELGYFQHRFAVYDRAGEPCPGCDCGGGIRRIVQSGRATFYCPQRQR